MALLLTAGCSDDVTTETIGSDDVALTIDVIENDWNKSNINIETRAGETMESLMATTGSLPSGFDYGFSLHGMNLLGPVGRRQVTWNSTSGQWDAGGRIYWKNQFGNSFNVYAYAPFKTSTYTYSEVSTGESSGWKGEITFPADAADGNNIDLLYAGTTVRRSNGLASLTFRHALAQISFGTITNNTGEDVTLTQIDFTGDFYSAGKLNLTSGAWTELTAFSPATKTYTRADFDSEVAGDQTLPLSQGAVQLLGITPVLLIPGPTATVTLTFSSGNTYNFDVTLEQGKNKTYNITVQKNFEIEIDW